MARSGQRTVKLVAEAIERLRCRLGLTLEELAARAKIDVRTLTRKLSGEPAYHQTAKGIASALGVDVEDLLPDLKAAGVSQSREGEGYAFNFTTVGVVRADQLRELVQVSSDLIARLTAMNIPIRSCVSNLQKIAEEDSRQPHAIVRIDAPVKDLRECGSLMYERYFGSFRPAYAYLIMTPRRYADLVKSKYLNEMLGSFYFDNHDCEGMALLTGVDWSSARNLIEVNLLRFLKR